MSLWTPLCPGIKRPLSERCVIDGRYFSRQRVCIVGGTMACVKSTGAARCTFVGGYVDDCCFFPLLLWVGSAWGYEWHLVPGTIFDSVEASGEVCRNFFTAGFLVSGITFEDMLRTTPSPPPRHTPLSATPCRSLLPSCPRPRYIGPTRWCRTRR